MAVKIPIVDYNGKLSELQSGDTIPGGGGSLTLTEIEVDFGTKPIKSKRFTVTDGSVTGSSKIIVFSSGNVAANRGSDDWEWDSINFVAKGNTGNFTIYAHSNTRVGGKRKIYYIIN